MGISLRPRTEKLMEERTVRDGYASPDELLVAALQALDQQWEYELDEETIRALEEADAQIERGEYRAWEEVREELRAKYLTMPEGDAGSGGDQGS